MSRDPLIDELLYRTHAAIDSTTRHRDPDDVFRRVLRKLGSAPPFVGRDELVSAAVGVLAKTGSFVLVEGEAGIGKTRLLQECLAAAELRKRGVVVAVCLPVRESRPLEPVVDGIRRLRREIAGVELSPLAGAVRPLFPEWAAHLPPRLEPLEDPAATRHRLFAALTEVIERLGVDVVVVEDLHWADNATLEWLLTLCGRRLSLAVTYRPLEVPAVSALRQLMSWRPVSTERLRLSLPPFTPTQTGELVAAMVGTELVSQEFVRSLHEHTDGLPLAVVEAVLLLRDRHSAIDRAIGRGGDWSREMLQELQIPPTVRDSVLERLERLDPHARTVLEAAAVLGAPADGTLLAEVAGLAEMVGVAGALASGLLQDSGPDRFTFRHALDAKTVDEALLAPQRRCLHRRAALALERLELRPVARLSRHWREAGELALWSRYAQESAERAMASGDDRTAVTVLQELLTAVEWPVREQVQIARKLGETAAFGSITLGELGPLVVQALRDVLAAEGLASPDRGEIRLLLGRVLRQERQEQAAAVEIQAAISDLGHNAALAGRAMLILAAMVHPDWTVGQHLEWVERASELRAKAASPMDQLAFTINRAAVLLLHGEQDGWRVADELPRSAPTLRERRMIAGGLVNSARLAMLWGHFDRAREHVDTALTKLQDSGHHRVVGTARVASLALDWYTGAWQDIAEAAALLCESHDSPTTTILQVRWIRGLFHLACGDRADAWRQLATLNAELISQSRFDPFIIPSAGLARLYLAEGAIAEAAAVTQSDIDLIARKGAWLWATDLAPVHVEALVARRRLDSADELVGQFARWARDRHVPAAAAALATCDATLSAGRGRHGTAAAQFAEAAQAWAALPRPYDQLLALEQRGRCLLAAGERDDALTALVDAHKRLRQLGARWDADRVAHMLRQHGVEVAVASRQGRQSHGPKTVQLLHVSNAMRKLKVTPRTALAVTTDEGSSDLSVYDSIMIA